MEYSWPSTSILMKSMFFRDALAKRQYSRASGRHQSALVLLMQPFLRFQRPAGIDLPQQSVATFCAEHRLNGLDPAGKLGIQFEISPELLDSPFRRLKCEDPPVGAN